MNDRAQAAGVGDEVPADAEMPAARSEPKPADTGREAEDVGGVVPDDVGGGVTEDVAGEVIEPEDGLTEDQVRRRDEALAEVRQFGDPALKSQAAEVSEFGPELEREAERMVRIMREAMGVGLAATQLGVMHRLLVFQAGLDATPTAVVNPRIEWLSDDLAVAEEGCLSLPGIAVDVERSLHARVSAVDTSGDPFLLEASGLEARVLQHEIDHLDGVLILDRTERAQRKGAFRALREGTTYSPPTADPDEA